MNTPRIAFALLTATHWAAASEAAAQWVVTADVAAARFWGGPQESGGARSFHPYRPTLFGIGLERTGAAIGLGLRGYYSGASLALEGPEAIIAVKDALDIYGAAAEVSIGLKRFDERVRLVAWSGPFVELWSLGSESSRARAGWNASIGLELAMGGRWSGVLRAGGAVSASPFSPEDLDTGFEPRALWRREVSGRIRFAPGAKERTN